MKNDRYNVVYKLADAYYKKSKAKNRILTCAIAMSIFLIYSVFAIISGKMDADYLLYARNGGEITSTYLENASKKQYESIKGLAYIQELGIKKYIGYAKVNKTDDGIVEYLDKTGFEKLVMPAYGEIHGKYPEKVNEIMLPIRWLKEYGIDNPKIGMGITMQIQNKETGDEYENKAMILSGYYTDYVDPGINAPIAYVSYEYLNEQKMDIFPVDEIMLLQSNLYDAFSIEEQLYQDVEMLDEQQQFIGQNTLARQSVQDLFGSYLVMVCCILVIMISAFLLIYNVVNISIRKEIRQYGLLKTLGCSLKQLKKIVRLQTKKMLLRGVIIGGILGLGLVGIFLRGTLEKLFLKGKGAADSVTAFYWGYLLLAIGIVSLTTIFATNLAVKKIMHLSAIESIRYSEYGNRIFVKHTHSTKRTSILWMAWRNVKRIPTKFIISIVSLFIGYTATLGALVITVGTDTTNNILKNPDFKISSIIEMHMISEYIPKEYTDQTPVIPKSEIKAIKAIDGIETVNLSKGGFAVIHPQEDRALSPKMKAGGGESRKEFATLQIVDQKYIEELEQYVQKYKISADIESLKKGEGVILLHHHELSPVLEQEAEKAQGSNISFYTLESYGEKSNEKVKLGEMKCAGYMDMKNKHFPNLQMTTNGTNIVYFIISQEGFEKLGMDEKYFAISLNVNPVKEPVIKQNVEKLVQNINKKSQEWNQLLLYSNSDLLASAQNYIKVTNLILGTLGIILLAIGIMNYWNTIITGIQTRKHELVMMESIGMTGKQLKTLLIAEGIWHWGIVIFLVGTVGYGILWLMGKSIKEELAYFRFYYPWGLFLILAIVLLGVTILIAELIYNETKKGSIAERLRIDTE